MKNIILILISLTLLSSCDKESRVESSFKRQFKKHMQRNMNDPDSYEFAEINIIINERKKKEDSLDLVALQYWTPGTVQWETVYKGRQDRRDELIKSGYLMEYNKVGIIKWRGNNSYGAKILNESYFYANDKNEIYEIDGKKIY